jgi:hypothetical protein
VRTRAEYKDWVADQINKFLRLFYVLLAMAVVIAIFGIVLTPAPSVFERRARSACWGPSASRRTAFGR